VNAGSSTTGTIQYKLGDSGEYSTSIPIATNAGTYLVYYKVIGDDNHNDVDEASVSTSIAKASGSVTAPTAKSLTYTGSAQALVNAGSSSTGTIQYKLDSGEYSTTIPTAINAGSYTVYYKVVGDSNHNDVAEASVSVTIATKAMTVSATNGSATYSGSATNGGASVSVTTPSSGYTIKYGTTSGTYDLTSIPTYTNAGTYTIYYQVTATNYTKKTGSFTITIAKASGSVTAPTAKSLTYTGSSQALVNAGSSSTGTIQYKLDSGEYSTTIPTATNAGSYTVYYKVVGDSNHNDVAEASVSVTIATKAMTVSATNGSATYSGSATNGGASVSVTVPSSGYTIKYGTTSGTYDLTSIPTYTNAGTYTIYYQVTATNYTTKTGSFTITISKASGSVTKPTAKSLTYTGSAQALVNAGSSTTGTIQYKLGDSGSYSTTIPTATNAGSYTVYYKVIGDSNHNDVAEASVSVTIATKAMTVSATNGSATYSGSATNGGASVSVTVPSSGATIKYGTTSGTYDLTSIPTYTNAGTYTIYYQVTATNYTTKTGSLTITINKANGSVTKPTAKSLTYTGSAQALVNAGSSTTGTIQYKLGDSGNYSTTIPTATNAGTYTVYYKVVGDSNHNDVSEASVSVTIAKASGSVTAPTAKSLTYSGSSQALVNAGSSSTGTIQYKLGSSGAYSTTIPTATNVGTYTVYYKVVGDSNHNDVSEASVSVTISKPTISSSSWSAIQAACKAGLAKEYFSVGDTRTISLGGVYSASNGPSAQTATIVVGDISSDGKTLTMLFTSYSTLTPTYFMNTSATNDGGWASTSMRSLLNDSSSGGFYNALPSDLKNVIKTHSTSYSATYDATSVSYCDDNLWLLSEKEVFGSQTYENESASNAETQLAYFANGGDKVRYKSGTNTCYWWLRSSYYNSDSKFVIVGSDGSINYGSGWSSNAMFPAFCIG
jgi:methionine-rich copper-binding protein CopC